MSTARPASQGMMWDGREVLPFVIIGAAGMTVGGLYATTGLAALVSGHGWAKLTLHDVPQVVKGLFRDPGHPNMAYPATLAHRIPAAPVFYTVAAVLVVLVTLLVAVVWRVVAGAGGGVSPKAVAPPRSAKVHRYRAELPNNRSQVFARKRHLRGLVGTRPGGIRLGYAYGEVLSLPPTHNLLAVGPAQSGKTTGLVEPAVLDWVGPAIVVSTKTDVLAACYNARARRGRVWVFDPEGVSGLPSDSSNPLTDCTTWPGSVRVADEIVAAAGGMTGVGDQHFWSTIASDVLTPLFLGAALTGRTMRHVTDWLRLKSVEDLIGQPVDRRNPRGAYTGGLLCDVDTPDARRALTALIGLHTSEERWRESQFGTAKAMVHVYDNDRVLDVCEYNDITADALLAGPNTLFVVGSSIEQRRLAPVFVALLSTLVAGVFARASRNRADFGAPIRDDTERVLLVLDECSNMARLRDLPAIASQSAGEGLNLLTAVQAMDQLAAAYQEQVGALFANHLGHLLLPGSTDELTHRMFRGNVGRETVVRDSRTMGPGGHSRHRGEQDRNVLEDNDVRQLPDHTALLIDGSRRPAWIGLSYAWQDRTLRSEVSAPVVRPRPEREPLPEPTPVPWREQRTRQQEEDRVQEGTKAKLPADPLPVKPAGPTCRCGCSLEQHRGQHRRGGCRRHPTCTRFKVGDNPTADSVDPERMERHLADGAALPLNGGLLLPGGYVYFDGRFWQPTDGVWAPVVAADTAETLGVEYAAAVNSLTAAALAAVRTGGDVLRLSVEAAPDAPFLFGGRFFVPTEVVDGEVRAVRIVLDPDQVAALRDTVTRVQAVPNEEGDL